MNDSIILFIDYQIGLTCGMRTDASSGSDRTLLGAMLSREVWLQEGC